MYGDSGRQPRHAALESSFLAFLLQLLTLFGYGNLFCLIFLDCDRLMEAPKMVAIASMDRRQLAQEVAARCGEPVGDDPADKEGRSSETLRAVLAQDSIHSGQADDSNRDGDEVDYTASFIEVKFEARAKKSKQKSSCLMTGCVIPNLLSMPMDAYQVCLLDICLCMPHI